jgi:cadmium resistance protein CadD (predicted permease)
VTAGSPLPFSQVGQAVGLFAVTNVDDLVILALYFAKARGQRHGVARVVLGQYLGFVALVAIATAGALGVRLLPESVVPYFGLLPLLLGLRAGWQAWRERRDADEPAADQANGGVGVLAVAAVTFANGGDNIAVYVPVFATAGDAGLIAYITTFLVLVAVWCAAALFFATRPGVARALARWGHVVLPVVLVALGLVILVGGGAFGL